MFLVKGKRGQLKGPVSMVMKILLVIIAAVGLYLIIKRVANAFAP